MEIRKSEYDERDDPQERDENDLPDDESCTLPCPACGAEIYEDADRCDRCGEWIIQTVGGARRRLRRWWRLVGLVAGLAAVAAFFLF